MQRSPFNSIVNAADGGTLAFNHVTGVLLRVSQSVGAFLRGEKGAGVSPRVIGVLWRGHFLVRSAEEERQYVALRLGEMRAASQGVHYTLVLTYACNLRCPYCYESANRPSGAHMTRDLAERIAAAIEQDLAESGAPRLGITLYGGEPFLNLGTGVFLLERLAEHCRHRGIAFSAWAISNGTELTAERIAAVRPYLQVMQLTLDGGPAEHDQLRTTADGRGTFYRILESSAALLAAGMRVIFRIQITPQNVSSLDSALESLEEHGLLRHPGVSVYAFPILDIAKVCSSRTFECSHRYFDPKLTQIVWESGARHGLDLWQLPQPAWKRPFCSFVSAGAWIVDPFGYRYKCVAQVGVPEFAVGSVLSEQDAATRQHWTDRAMAFVHRSGATIERCRQCEFMPGCDGGCAYLAQMTTGDMAQPSCDTYGQIVPAQLRQMGAKALGAQLAKAELR